MISQNIFDFAIWVLWAFLNYVDCILVIISYFKNAISAKKHTNSSKRAKVVIVGASFAGLAAEQILSRHREELDLTIVDYKSYFEYVPGALRCFIDPSYFSNAISCPLSVVGAKNGTNVIQGKVIDLTVAKTNKSRTKNELILDDGRKLPFDYLVLAAGSTYSSPIKATSVESTAKRRQKQWNDVAAELTSARTVLIMGAGAVGVELAGEILTKYPKSKKLILMDMSQQILPGFNKASVNYAYKWLQNKNVELKLGVSIKEMGETFVLLANGEKLEVDIIYKCFGAKPNTDFLKQGPFGSLLKGPKGALLLNDHLQAQGYGHVFCAGDMCHHAPSNEIKLGHTAEVNGHLVAENILRLACSSPTKGNVGDLKPKLLMYPYGVVGNEKTPFIYDLSLGKYDATLGFNSLVIHGTIAAILKWIIEWTKVAAAARRPVGILFWAFGDAVSNLLGRTIIPTSLPNKKVV